MTTRALEAWQTCIGVLATCGVRAARTADYRGARSEHALVAVGSMVLSAFFAPLYTFVRLLPRDAASAPYIPDGS